MNEHQDLLVNTGPCPVCNDPAPRAVEMPYCALVEWVHGAPLEVAWPEGGARQRRQLLDGTCPHHLMDETSRT